MHLKNLAPKAEREPMAAKLCEDIAKLQHKTTRLTTVCTKIAKGEAVKEENQSRLQQELDIVITEWSKITDWATRFQFLGQLQPKRKRPSRKQLH